MNKRTATRSFGTGNRESHNAAAFYGRKLFSASSTDGTIGERNPMAEDILDRIYQHSSEEMPELPDNSVALMVTSPPYNVGKEYDRDMSLEDYLGFLRQVLRETFRVLLPGGRVAFNVANLGRKPYIPLNAHIAAIALEVGFLMRGEIIWVKGKGASGSCAWGSWMSAANPTLRDVHEYVLVFSKNCFGRPDKGQSTVTRDEFMTGTTSVWHIPPESARRVGHPAPFPVALVERLIRLYTFENDVVLDPFMGSGSTAVAAVNCNRRYVGYEIDEQYISLCQRRLSSGNESPVLSSCRSAV